MYGLPPGIDLSFLRDKELIQICFGPHDLQLHLFEQASVLVESSIGLILPGSSMRRHEDFREGATELLRLLGRMIEAADGSSDGTLRLQFDNGIVLFIYDDSDQFESYTIRDGDKLIIV